MAFWAMRSSPAYVPFPPLREGICLTESLETAGGLPHARGFPALGVLCRPPTPPGTFAALRTNLSGTALSPFRALVIAFRAPKPVGPRIIDLRGWIASPLRVAAWTSRCLRFAAALTDVHARLASPWVASPSTTGISPALCSQLHGALGGHLGRATGLSFRMSIDG